MAVITTSQAAVRTLVIDKAHSEAVFQVRHLVTKVRGRFADFEGTIQFDQAKPERSSVSFTVQAGSVDTNQPERDQHLRSEDFFFVDRYPVLTFTSDRVSQNGQGQYDVAGALTIRGVTRHVTLPVAYLGTANDPWGNTKVGFETEITLNRKDFGLVWNAALEAGGFLVGDEVRVALSIQAAVRN